MLLKRKGEGGGEGKGEKDFPGKSLNHRESISPRRPSNSKASRAMQNMQQGGAPTSSLPFIPLYEGIMSLQDPFGCLGHAIITCVLSAREEGHFPARQGGAQGKCGLWNETSPFH